MTTQVAQLQDAREPSQRQHEAAMVNGSQTLIACLWAEHASVMQRLTGRMVQ